jgi:OMF family outer membrane factor
VLLAAASASAEPQKLTFQQAIDMSLKDNPDIAIAKEAINGAEARIDEQKGHRIAQLNVNANADLYTEPYQLPFGTEVFTLHKQFIWNSTVQLSQPLTGLGYLTELVDAAKNETDAVKQDYQRTRLDTAYKTADAYIRVLEARAAAEVAHQSVADTTQLLTRAEELKAADTYTAVDVLRFKTAKAAADQAALRADTAILTTLANLTVQLGLHDGAPIDITDDLPVQAPKLVYSLEAAQKRALDTRPELAAAALRIKAAEEQKTAAKYKYAPDVRLTAQWLHTYGVDPFQPKNEEWLGLTANWAVWDWGSTHAQVKQAESAKTRAELQQGALVDQVKLDMRRRYLEAKTQFDSIAVAQTQQDSAQAAYDLQKTRLENGVATTTDVLDSETELAKAKLQLANARYDYYLALVALARSVGDLPQQGAAGGR